MKNCLILIVCVVLTAAVHAETYDWQGLKLDRIELKLPLLTIQGNKGLLACGYVNVNTCNKTGEACAIVSGVKNHQEMLAKPVIAVSDSASKLGIELGMTGADALAILR